jgi:MFS family permease
MIALGYGLASYMGMAFFYASDPVAKWRGPLGVALLFPIIMLAILPFIPESPRFLLMKGRVDEAREIVLKLHKIPGDPDNEFARGEFYQMAKQAELDRTVRVTWVSKIAWNSREMEANIKRSGKCSPSHPIASERLWPWALHLSANQQLCLSSTSKSSEYPLAMSH